MTTLYAIRTYNMCVCVCVICVYIIYVYYIMCGHSKQIIKFQIILYESIIVEQKGDFRITPSRERIK